MPAGTAAMPAEKQEKPPTVHIRRISTGLAHSSLSRSIRGGMGVAVGVVSGYDSCQSWPSRTTAGEQSWLVKCIGATWRSPTFAQAGSRFFVLWCCAASGMAL